MSEWVPHSGGLCPVKPARLVQVKMRDGATEKVRPARYWVADDEDRDYWRHEPNDHHNDIIAYRLVETPNEDQ